MSRPIHKRNWTCQSNKALLKVMYYSCINKTWVISKATFIWRNCALLYVTFCSWHVYVAVSKLVILFRWDYVCVCDYIYSLYIHRHKSIDIIGWNSVLIIFIFYILYLHNNNIWFFAISNCSTNWIKIIQIP